MEATILSIVFALLSGTYIYRSFQIIDEGQIALVERFGKYQKTMKPGINIVLPLIDRVALIKSSREQVLEMKPLPCMTSDNVSVNVSAAMYWQISNLKDARYKIEDVDQSLQVSLSTQIQTQIGRYKLDYIIGGQESINKDIVEGIQSDTKAWGIDVLRVRLGEITIPPSVLQSMEKQKAAEIEKKAMISLSEGEKTSEITKAEAEASSKKMIANSEREVKLQQTEAIALSIERIAKAIADNPHGMDAVHYLLAQKYLEMGQAIGQSPSSKVLFMDPKSIPAAIQSLLSMSDSFNGSNSNFTQPFGAAGNMPPIFNNFPEIQSKPPNSIDNTDPSKN
ncbi:SPFH/Band 7/PHB domain protein [Pseudanabaena sp. FACHB-1277]|jgi:regulator of protease activity HflC (stomatin/prohibitin superfamily)|uniref:SPFH/Band 7/PHB domain protein n=1 Tax=Pseudanabaena cinerea FACHB-1277 TaxID=2949581 RepID=A0A926UVH5_9CYAN|nr:SPFH domain-containing protein [Pseudanabaena cinerea]MBD2150762.1 SPFH/Band 7/PHB domain protein [Pseudanabaena cinerea FACHB-1277]